MNINVDYNTLIEKGLTLSEYSYLKALYFSEDMVIIDQVLYDGYNKYDLENKGFIKIRKSKVILRNKGIALFEGQDLFLKFLNTFPIKTPAGRYLSPLGDTGILVRKIKKRWDKYLKNKPDLQIKVIKILEAELAWRRNSGQMNYISAIDVWLNNAHWEKYEYLLSKDVEHEEDLM